MQEKNTESVVFDVVCDDDDGDESVIGIYTPVSALKYVFCLSLFRHILEKA